MTDQQRSDWFGGRWIAIRPAIMTCWVVRRMERGKVIGNGKTFPSEKSAQRYADKLNRKGDKS